MTPPDRAPDEDGTLDLPPSTRLLWAVGIPAGALAVAAFLLWGFAGAEIVIDMIAFYCA